MLTLPQPLLTFPPHPPRSPPALFVLKLARHTVRSPMSGAATQHGGVQMRLKRARVAANPESSLAQYLIEEAVWGHMMMPMVQKIARLAHQDV